MSQLLAGITFTVSICIGTFALSLSVDNKGQFKADAAHSAGSLGTGYAACLNCGSKNNEGTGRYVKHTSPSKLTYVETKIYRDGKTSTDLVFSAKVCNKEEICLKGAVKERLVDNFDVKKGFGFSYPPFKDKSQSNKINLTNSPDLSRINKITTSPSQPMNSPLNLALPLKSVLPLKSAKATSRQLPNKKLTYNFPLNSLALQASAARLLSTNSDKSINSWNYSKNKQLSLTNSNIIFKNNLLK